MPKLIVLFFFLNTTVIAQTTTPDSAKYFEGSLKTVCGTVSNTDIGHSVAIFINFGRPFQLSDFMAVIFATDTAKFTQYKPEEYLSDKFICVSGTIKMYKGKPEIIVKSPDQIRIPDSKE